MLVISWNLRFKVGPYKKYGQLGGSVLNLNLPKFLAPQSGFRGQVLLIVLQEW